MNTNISTVSSPLKSQTQNVDIAASISQEELKILQEFFSNIEEVDEESFIKLFRSLGGQFADFDENDYLRFFQKVDANANGMLDLDELLTFLLVGAEGQRRMNDVAKESSNIKWFRGNNTNTNVHKAKINKIVLDSQNEKYITSSKDGSIKIWNSTNLQFEKTLHQSANSITDMCLIPKRNSIVACDIGKKIYIYDIPSRRLDRIFQGSLSNYELFSKSNSNTSRYLGSPSKYRKEISDLKENNQDRFSESERSSIKNVGYYPTVTLEKLGKRGNAPMAISVYHPNNSQDYLIIGCENGKVQIYDITDKILESNILKPLYSGNLFSSSISSMVNAHELGSVIIAGFSPTIEVFNLEKFGSISTLKGHKKPVYRVDYSNALNLIVSCGREKNVMIWNPLIKKPLEVLKGHKSIVIDVQFNTKDMELITLSEDKILKVWDVRMYKCLQTYQNIGGLNTVVSAAAINSKLECVVCGGFEYGKADLISVPIQRSHLSFKAIYNGPTHSIVTVLLKQNFSEVIVADEFNVSIWNLLQGNLIYKFSVPEGVASCSFDPNQRRIIISYHNKNIGIYNYINGACLRKLNTEDEIYSCLFVDTTNYEDSSDEEKSIWALGDHSLMIWGDAEDDEEEDPTSIVPLSSSSLCGVSVEILCILGFEDGTLRLYDAHSGGVKMSKRFKQPRTIFTPITLSTHDLQKKRNAKWSLGTKLHSHVESILAPPKKFPLIIVSYGNGTVEFRSCIHLETSFVMRVNPNSEAICSMTIDPEGNTLIIGDSDGFVIVFDISTIKIIPPKTLKDSVEICVTEKNVKLLSRFRAFNDVVTSVSYDSERSLIIAGCSNTFVGVWTIHGKNVGFFGQTQKWDIDDSFTYGRGYSDKSIRSQQTEGVTEDSEIPKNTLIELSNLEKSRDTNIDLDDIENEISKKISEKYLSLDLSQIEIKSLKSKYKEADLSYLDSLIPRMGLKTKREM